MHVFLASDGWRAGGPCSSCTVDIFLSLFLLYHLTPWLIEKGGRNQEEAGWLLKDTELPVYLISHMKAFPGLFDGSKKNMCNFLLSLRFESLILKASLSSIPSC